MEDLTPGERETLASRLPDPTARLILALATLTPEERLEVFASFCTHCGDADPDCQCWNDD